MSEAGGWVHVTSRLYACCFLSLFVLKQEMLSRRRGSSKRWRWVCMYKQYGSGRNALSDELSFVASSCYIR